MKLKNVFFKLQKDNEDLKEEIKNKGDQLCKLKSLNESLIKEVSNLEQRKMRKCKKDE
jgi:hypothetical protein